MRFDRADAPAVADRATVLTDTFYAWERRGRGWQIWPYPIGLEPPFRPFYRFSGSSATPIDDGRRTTLFSTISDHVLGRRSLPSSSDAPAIEDVEPTPFQSEGELVEFQIHLPADHDNPIAASQRLLANLTRTHQPLGFEIVGTAQAITVQLSARTGDARHVRQQLQAHFPAATVQEAAGFVGNLFRRHDRETVVVDFGLAQEFMRPIRTALGKDDDVLAAIAGALGDLTSNEAGLIQILFHGVVHPWADSISRSVLGPDGHRFFADDPAMAKLAAQKIERPLVAAVLRVAAVSPDADRAWDIVTGLGSALAQLAEPASNELMPLTNDDYPDDRHWEDLVERVSCRGGMLLNVDELASLAHLPTAVVQSPLLARQTTRTKAAPAVALGHGLMLGENVHGGVRRPVTLGTEHRLRHTHVIGASGTGKSTLLLNMLLKDIAAGQGVGVIDPHGDLIDEVLARIPDDRLEDVILVDPADAEYPVGFNILSAHSEIEKTLLASDLVAVFRRLSTSWGDQMTSVLGNAVLAMLESESGGSLADLRRFLVEPDFRSEFLHGVRDDSVVYFWQREFPLLAGKPQAPILTRLDAFLRPRPIRAMVSQRQNRLDFGAMMNDGKIFLAKLAQGLIGEENAALLGTLFVSKFNQLALSRQALTERERRPFYLYVDEFQNFVSPSLATLLTGARKYRLGLVLAHQELRQLMRQDSDVADAVLANAATRICFRVGDDDATRLEKGFAVFEAQDLQNQGRGEAVCRIDRADWDFTLTAAPPPLAMPIATMAERQARVVDVSRRKYGARAEPERLPVKPARDIEPVVASAQPSISRWPRRPTAPPASRPLTAVAANAASLGRGGPQHKYVQELIKRWANAAGYTATIEKPILDGLGSVDVVLEKDGRSIACEICVTTSVEHEVQNARKCLAAGFDQVFLVANDARTVTAIGAALPEDLQSAPSDPIAVLTVEDLFVHARPADVPRVVTVGSYRVKVRRSASGGREDAARQVVAGTIAGALRRIRRK